MRFGDRQSERGGARCKAETLLREHAFALHGDPCLGIGERGREHDGGGVAGRVAFLVGDHIEAQLVVVVPWHPLGTDHPACERGDGFAPAGITRSEDHGVRAPLLRAQRTGVALECGGDGATPHGVGHPFADQLRRTTTHALHAVPFAAHEHTLHRHTREPLPIGAQRRHAHRTRVVGAPEPVIALSASRDVEVGRMQHRRRPPTHQPSIHIAHIG